MTHETVRVYVFCEGETEETFVKEILYRHLQERFRIFVTPINLGGVSKYEEVRKQINIQLKTDRAAWVTTMIDYYGLKDFLNKDNLSSSMSSYEKAKILQKAFQEDIGSSNFIANLMIHEFEALLFSDTEAFNKNFPADVVNKLKSICGKFETPEHINDSKNSAPSKRIASCCKGYDKIIHGNLIALDIGLETLRKQCHNFDEWVSKIENLAQAQQESVLHN
ncbi:MAG: DUF4276 family protein [Blastocatellia bacterium]|nr:DUF4276 family protein [Blastocatellia bacterium]